MECVYDKNILSKFEIAESNFCNDNCTLTTDPLNPDYTFCNGGILYVTRVSHISIRNVTISNNTGTATYVKSDDDKSGAVSIFEMMHSTTNMLL